MVEHRTFNLRVDGSNPSGLTKPPSKPVLLIGKGSFLAQGLLAWPGEVAFNAVSHRCDLSAIDFSAHGTVINAAFDQRYLAGEYNEEFGCHFVMLSTRKVYGLDPPFPVPECYKGAPLDHYGRNKLRTEAAILALMPQSSTILRVANIFGYELGRRSFFGIALSELLARKRIVLDVAASVRRDFLHIEDFARTLHDLLLLQTSGTFNLGAGHATEVGEIAEWLIEGAGFGELVVSQSRRYDSFLLDCEKLYTILPSARRKLDMRARCIEIGGRLANA